MKNIQKERWLIGCMIANEDTPKIIKQINIDYFTDTKLRDIFKSMEEINNRGLEVDFLTLNDYMLANVNWYTNEGGGILFLADLNNEADHLFIADSIIEELRELYKTRKLNNLYLDLKNADIDKAKEIRKEIDKVIEECNIKEQESKSEIDKIIDRAKETIENNKTKGLAGYSWGQSYKWLDEMTGGLRKGRTYRIAGQSGSGKTSFIYHVLNNVLEQTAKVVFIELEGQESLYFNFLSTILEKNPRDLEKGKEFADSDFLKKYEGYLFPILDINNLNELKSEIIKIKPDVVILDYIGLVSIPGFDENSKYSEYADQIKMFVQNNQDICFIDLSNLPKSDNSEEMIRLNRGFNGSAKLRNNCDFGLHIFDFPPFVKYKKDILQMGNHPEVLNSKVMTFLISKNRFGPDGIEKQYRINFDKGVKFTEVSENYIKTLEPYF